MGSSEQSGGLKPLLLGLATAAVLGALLGGGYLLGTAGGDDPGAEVITDNGEPAAAVEPAEPAGGTTVDPATSTAVATSTPPIVAPTLRPTAPPRPPDRTSCSAIQGTDYRSASERTWYLANCVLTPVPGPPVVHITTLVPGNCYDGAATSQVSWVSLVPCSGPYDYLVLVQFIVNPESSAFPGNDFLLAEGNSRCPSDTDVVIFPTGESWAEGRRTIMCVQCNLCDPLESLIASDPLTRLLAT